MLIDSCITEIKTCTRLSRNFTLARWLLVRDISVLFYLRMCPEEMKSTCLPVESHPSQVCQSSLNHISSFLWLIWSSYPELQFLSFLHAKVDHIPNETPGWYCHTYSNSPKVLGHNSCTTPRAFIVPHKLSQLEFPNSHTSNL